MNRRTRLTGAARVLAIAIAMLLSACRTIPVDDATVRSIEERQSQLRQFDQWQALGRIALNSADQGITAGIDWTQSQQDFRVSLDTPLGRALVVEQRGSVARLQSKGKPPKSGSNAALLIEQELRVRVPMQQLSLWLRGLPGDEGIPAYDKFGRLKLLRYTDPDGIAWRADIQRYQQIDQLDLPGLIVVEGGGYNIRVSVTNWNPLAESALAPEMADPEAPKPETDKVNKRIVIPGLSS